MKITGVKLMTGNDDRTARERPALLVKAARIGARGYYRRRDLSAAVSGLLLRPEREILPELGRQEAMLEAMRRCRSPAYRPVRHLQVLIALVAESRSANMPPVVQPCDVMDDQANASGSDSLRFAMKSRRPSSTPASIGGWT